MNNVSKPRAAIYARFSSDKQNERSIEDQVARCRDNICAPNGYEIVAVYEDRAISGASMITREGWKRLVRAAEKGEFDIVVADDIDRITRDEADWHTTRKRLNFLGIKIFDRRGEARGIEASVRATMNAHFLENLAHKTRGGLEGVVRDGRSAGGKSYGYETVPGKTGRLRVIESEAIIVRRVFAEYLDGRSPREIAARLNKEGVPGPRGHVWNASTIAGSRKRANGILQNALYDGRIVWNRQRFTKHPDTGRRVSRPNSRALWKTAHDESLRIVGPEIFAAAQKRKESRGAGFERTYRPKHLLSGLLKCGECGSGYVVSGTDKRGRILRCSQVRETGLCSNKRTISMEKVERQIIDGMVAHLADPELIAEFVREFHASMEELRRAGSADLRAAEKRLPEVNAAIERLIDALAAGESKAVRERLAKFEAEKESLEANIEAASVAPIRLHPRAADIYREKVASLAETVERLDDGNRNEAFEALRELVEKIVVKPSGRYKPVDLEIHGTLASVISDNCTATESVTALVAGAGFEPATFRL